MLAASSFAQSPPPADVCLARYMQITNVLKKELPTDFSKLNCDHFATEAMKKISQSGCTRYMVRDLSPEGHSTFQNAFDNGASRIPNPNQYIGTTIASQTGLMIRAKCLAHQQQK